MCAEPLPSLADWIGRHALASFLLLLVVVLWAVALLARLWHRPPWPQARDALPPPALLLLGVAAGFALLLGAASGFAALAERLLDGGCMTQLDEALRRAIAAHVGLRTLQVFHALTRLGDAAVLLALAGVVALGLAGRGRAALAWAWLLALAGNALLVALLKRIFMRVRPPHEHGLLSEMGYSFPSGHAAGATVAYGMLAYVALRVLPLRWQRPVLLLAAALVFTVGASRVFLQVHYASDVLAGFAWGAAWLLVCVLSVELSRRWWQPAR